MAKKDDGKNPPKSRKLKTARVNKAPEDIFAFWTEEKMAEAKPISINLDRPADDPEEK